MKKFMQFLKTQPIATASLIFILLLYFIMIFAEFFAPYTPTHTFENAVFHNIDALDAIVSKRGDAVAVDFLSADRHGHGGGA